jgi:hypothetical protein
MIYISFFAFVSCFLKSKQADQVLVYNKKVLDKDRELRQELELTQTTQKEMVRRLALYQRLIKQLNEKVSNQVRKVCYSI